MKKAFIALIVVVSLLFLGVYIEQRINHKVHQIMSVIDITEIERQKNNLKLIGKLTLEAKKASQFVEKTVKRISNIAESVERGNIVITDGGELTLSSVNNEGLNNPSGCVANRGYNKHQILFSQSFLEPPQVIASLSSLDFRDGTDHRIQLKISNITKQSFVINFNTWCDTKLSMAKATWLAVGI